MKGMIVIDQELCKGCGYCAISCPVGVIVMKKRFNKKGFFPASAEQMGRCTGCTICARMCPEVAIEVYREDNASHSRAE